MYVLRRKDRSQGFRRQGLRFAAVTVLLPVVLIFAYLVAGTIGGLVRTGQFASTGGIAVYLLPGAIHTDLLLPVTALTRETFGFLEGAGLPVSNPNTAWIVIGWGARDFYTTTGQYRDLQAGPVWRAISGDDAVMRVELAPKVNISDDLTRVLLTDDQFGRLVKGIRASFSQAIPQALPVPGLTGRDRFFPATGRFTVFRTCNVWVGDVLRAAGVRVGVWTPVTWSLP